MKILKDIDTPKILLWASLGVFLLFTSDVLIQSGISNHFDFSTASNYGELLGGFFSFISVILIYFTIKYQIDSFNKSQFESRYFELIRYHKENVDKFEHRLARVSDFNNPVMTKASSVIIYIYKDISKALNHIEHHFEGVKPSEIYLNETIYLSEKSNPIISSRNINLIDLLKLNFAYLIVFFGVHKEGRLILERILNKKYNNLFVKNILDTVQKIPAEWDKNKYKGERQDRIDKNIHFKYFGGHQTRLGHYFRHLFQTVSFVNDSKILKYREKYSYIKILRAQLTTFEQYILFFNSLSDIGRRWEIGNEYEPCTQIDDAFITKYNMIKNIPAEFITDINVKMYYPDVEYEGSQRTGNRESLERRYK